MSLQTAKLELIKRIADIRNEKLLERLKKFLQKAEMEELKARPNALSKEETFLLSAINEGLPEDTQSRLEILQRQQKSSGLSSIEQEELAQIIDTLEILEAKRLEHMISLAQLWEMTLDQVRDRLGIKAAEPYVW